MGKNCTHTTHTHTHGCKTERREAGTTAPWASAPLHSTDLLVEEKVTGGASVKGEPSDNFYQSVDASVSFRCEAWRYFGFLVSRNEKEQWTDRQTKDTTQTPEPTHTYGAISHLF